MTGRARWGLTLAFVAVAAGAAALLPGEWFVPPPELTPRTGPGFDPATFARILLAFDAALALLWGAGAIRWPVRRSDPELPLASPEELAGDVRRPAAWLLAIVLIAAALRLYGLNAQLWVDEAAILVGYGSQSVRDLFLATPGLNNHLLYSLALRASVTVLGMEPWTARLPAAIAGVATVPAVYLLARRAVSRRNALIAAALVAVSYHHVFFSQNARGYTFLALGAVVSTWLFLRALERDTTIDWALYGVACFFTVGSIVFGVFIPAGHALVWVWLVVRRWLAGRRPWPYAGRAPLVWAVAALASVHVYAGALPYRIKFVVHAAVPSSSNSTAAFSLSQADRLGQLVRGLADGLGGVGGVLLVILLVPVAAGLPALVRRRPWWVAALAAPLVLMVLTLPWLAWSPRYFLVGLPAALILVSAAAGSAPWGRRALPAALLIAFAALSFASLPRYYRVPKQASRDSLAWIAGRAERGDRVALVTNTGVLGLYYAPEVAPRLEVVRVERLEDLAALDPRPVWALTTFEDALRAERPDLFAAIEAGYARVGTFPATIENGEITVWHARLPEGAP